MVYMLYNLCCKIFERVHPTHRLQDACDAILNLASVIFTMGSFFPKLFFS